MSCSSWVKWGSSHSSVNSARCLVPPPHRVPDPVGLGTRPSSRAVHEGVRRHLVRRHPRDAAVGDCAARLAVLLDVLRHRLDGLQDRERQQSEPSCRPAGRAAVARRRHPARRVRVLARASASPCAWGSRGTCRGTRSTRSPTCRRRPRWPPATARGWRRGRRRTRSAPSASTGRCPTRRARRRGCRRSRPSRPRASAG